MLCNPVTSTMMDLARRLPASEQFQVGGLYTVRGFAQGFRTDDHGYRVSGKLQVAASRVVGTRGPVVDAIMLAAFVDHGAAFAFKGAGQSIDQDDFLTSAGLGVTVRPSQQVSARLYVGFPLGRHDDDPDGAQVHLTVSFTGLWRIRVSHGGRYCGRGIPRPVSGLTHPPTGALPAPP